MRKIALALTVLGIGTGGAVAAESVKVGYTRTATDIALYVADKRGYFKAEGLDVSLVNMQSAAVMIVPMTSGDIDVMAGSASAGLYNAIARGLDIRLVASKVTTPKGFTSQTLIVRKDLFDSGKIKSVADLKGQKIANSGTGTAALGTMRRMLKTGGLTLKDIDMVALAFPQMRTALENGAIVAALPAEPVTTQTVNAGVAVKLIKDDEAYPGHEIASFMYSSKLLKERREVGLKFMRALIRGARDHNDGLDDKGMFAGPKGDAIIAILNEYTPVKDPNFFKTFALAYCDPDGAISVDSLRQQVVKELGPYRKVN